MIRIITGINKIVLISRILKERSELMYLEWLNKRAKKIKTIEKR
jgi:hypothetical protein